MASAVPVPGLLEGPNRPLDMHMTGKTRLTANVLGGRRGDVVSKSRVFHAGLALLAVGLASTVKSPAVSCKPGADIMSADLNR